jgi:membrane protein YdbS with pleckstrin-like domain
MKIFIYVIFISSIILILSGYLIDGINSEKLIGLGTVLLFFIVIPLFLYYRWKNKSFKDFILKNDNIKKGSKL